jgi:pyruvate dehydrogenase E2 component (dihydrolipoamide acetyltransferase)
MARSVIMPKTGMAMEEGTIVRWLKKPGDTIAKGEAIAVIETDKVTMELEAEDEGTLLGIVHGDGTVVKATNTIAWIGAPGERIEAAPAGPEPGSPRGAAATDTPTGQAPAAATGTPLETVAGRVPATPAARRLAAEAGLSLGTVKGSGPGGAVRARDVAGATAAAASAAAPRATPLARRVAEMRGVDLAAVDGTGSGGRIRRADVEARAAAAATPATLPASGTALPMTGMRRAIAEKMLRSHQSVPSVTLVTRADVSELAELRAKINATGGPKVSFTDFVVRAVATALREQPLLNSVVDGDRVVLRDEVNVGVAVALDAGLIVPVIRGADHLGVRQVSEMLRDLSARARAGSLVPADCTGGTFTITNLGMYGITEFTPLINVPESAILGVGAVEEVLRRGADGSIGDHKLMSLCLTHDHRHIDGAPAAVFLGRVKALLENCWSLLA